MKLKPLVWRLVRGTHYARCGFVSYGVREVAGGFVYWIADGSGRASDAVCDSIDHGKALCQADYERRVGELFESHKTDCVCVTCEDRHDAEMFRKLVKLMEQATSYTRRFEAWTNNEGESPGAIIELFGRRIAEGSTIRAAIEAAMGGEVNGG